MKFYIATCKDRFKHTLLLVIVYENHLHNEYLSKGESPYMTVLLKAYIYTVDGN